MKHFPLKKKSSGRRRKTFVPEGVRTTMPKPNFPRVVMWDAHKPGRPKEKPSDALNRE
jgi:hypothetical protein